MARRIDGVRASIERQNGSQPDAAKLEATLRDISQKLDRPSVPGANPDALAAMFQDLATRIDRRANPTIDTTPIEQALRSIGDRPVEIDTTPIENMMRDLGAKLVAPTAPDMRSLEGLLREINQKLDRGATAATPPGEIEAMIRDLGARIDQRVVPSIDIHPLEEALRALNQRLDLGAAPKLDPNFVEQAADLFAERLGRRDGPSVDADALASQISEIHDRLDALQPDASSKSALDPRTVADLIAELDTTRKTLQSLREFAPPDNDDIADGLADLRAEQASADKRTQARLAGLQDVLERLVDRLGRVDEGARAEAPGAANAARTVSPIGVGEASNATDAALRGIPDRAAAAKGPGEPARSDKPDQAGQAPSPRSLDGSDFLLEPGASLPRARALESSEFPSSKSAVNAHIAAARRAAQAALAEGAAKEGKSRPAAESADARERARGSAGGRAKAFFAARRRPILLGAALLAAIATFAVVELRGARHPLMQKSECRRRRSQTRTPISPGSPRSPAPRRSIPIRSARSPRRRRRQRAPRAPPPASRPRFRPICRRLCARPRRPATRPPNSNWRCASSKAAASPRTSARRRNGSSAAAQDLPLAQYRLATLYEKGVGVARDTALARCLVSEGGERRQRARDAQSGGAQRRGRPAASPTTRKPRNGSAKRGQLGVRDSQFNLGVLYGRGLGVPQDLGAVLAVVLAGGPAGRRRRRPRSATKSRPRWTRTRSPPRARRWPISSCDAVAGRQRSARAARRLGRRTARASPHSRAPRTPSRRDGRGSPTARHATTARRIRLRQARFALDRRRRAPVSVTPALASRVRRHAHGAAWPPDSPAPDRHQRPARQIFPYDYYRDRPDDTVGLAKTATLIAARARRSRQCAAARQRRHHPGHAARRLCGAGDRAEARRDLIR